MEEYITKFMEKYGYPEWPVKFRPGDKRTTLFGIDKTYDRLRWHMAVDIAGPRFMTYVPFDTRNVTFIEAGGGFGTLLFMPVEDADFEVRIAHFRKDDLDPFFEAHLDRYTKVPAGSVIGQQYGFEGLGTGTHIHVEYVSTGKRSEVLDRIMEQTCPELINESITVKEWKEYADMIGYPEEKAAEDFEYEVNRRKLQSLNPVYSARLDYMTGNTVEKTWYNSYILFNKM